MRYTEEKETKKSSFFQVVNARSRWDKSADSYFSVICKTAFFFSGKILWMGLNGVKLNYSGGDRGGKGDVPKMRFTLDKIHQSGWKSKYNSEEAIRLSIRQMLDKRSALSA